VGARDERRAGFIFINRVWLLAVGNSPKEELALPDRCSDDEAQRDSRESGAVGELGSWGRKYFLEGKGSALSSEEDPSRWEA